MEDSYQDKKYQRAKKRVEDIKGVYHHLFSYVGVLIFLAILNYVIDKWEHPWFLWVALSWGIGLVVHILCVVNWNPFLGKDWEVNVILNDLKMEKSIKYDRAKNRVRKIRRFYKHLSIYIIVNIIIFIINTYNLNPNESYFEFKNFSTVIFWGIGLCIHAFMIFGVPYLFGNDWEERKIKKLMDDDQRTSNNVKRWE